MAYVASGVHNPSDRPKTQVISTLDELRCSSKLIKGKGLQFTFHQVNPPANEDPFLYSSDEIDIVLVQLFADIFFITQSQDTGRLEEIIRAELGISAPSPAAASSIE